MALLTALESYIDDQTEIKDVGLICAELAIQLANNLANTLKLNEQERQDYYQLYFDKLNDMKMKSIAYDKILDKRKIEHYKETGE